MASREPLKVLYLSAEVAPFVTVGGLSQVGYFLCRAIKKLGVDIRIFTPKYGIINEGKFPTKIITQGLRVPTGVTDDQNPVSLICNVKEFKGGSKTEAPVYFLENMEYYEKRANVYGYSDDHVRFGLLSRGTLEFIKTKYFVPDLIHVNDWHTAYLPNYLALDYKDDPTLRKVATLLSVHNLFQGNFDFSHASEMDFDDGKSPLEPFFSDLFIKQNALKRGVIYADIVNTVSETYSREIMKEEYGQGLDKLFKELRGKLYGVLNGLDYQDFNPATDKIIKHNFSIGNLDARMENKADLQKEFGLPVNPEIPIIAVSGRLDWQKGLDLVCQVMWYVLGEMDVQFIALGGGDVVFRDQILELERRFPTKVGTHLMPNFILPRKIFAGADIILQTSRFEPGGIVPIESMRYGAIVVARATGGLADSVFDYDPAKNTGTGFVFKDFSKESFLVALVRALETYKNKKAWRELVKRGMSRDFSWENVAGKYIDLYQRAIEFRKEALLPNPPQAFRQTVG
jgi:starch synthase